MTTMTKRAFRTSAQGQDGQMAQATGVRPRGAGKAQLHDTALRLGISAE